ncbi:MAG: hypothetical protein IJM74_02175 [Bacteroidales bacterium]|nr:hypothetical protein [Bacteroidales bacterium]
MPLPHIIALTLVSATWGAAVLLFLGGTPVGRVGAGVFFAAKGINIFITVLALLRKRRLAWQLFCSRYRFDTDRRHAVSQAVTRFTWELPQLFLSYAIAQVRVVIGNVDRVDTLGGVTYVTCCHRKEHAYTGMSLGCFVQMWIPVEIRTDFEHYARHYAGRIFLHEYGHTVDSQLWGWLYLPVIGLPSIISQWMELAVISRHRHDNLYAEHWANRHAEKHFNN